MNVNTEALTTIRAIRARTDPIIVLDAIDEDGNTEFTVENPDQLVVKERLDKITQRGTGSPRHVATWGDTAFSLSQSSLSSALIVQDYTLALSTMIAFERFTDYANIGVPDTHLSWDTISNADDQELSTLLRHTSVSPESFEKDKVTDKLEQLRHGIAWTQHQLFIEDIYHLLPDTLTSEVPKAFWKQPNNVVDNLMDDEDTGQTGLGDF
jgi:hypothetical protein